MPSLLTASYKISDEGQDTLDQPTHYKYTK